MRIHKYLNDVSRKIFENALLCKTPVYLYTQTGLIGVHGSDNSLRRNYKGDEYSNSLLIGIYKFDNKNMSVRSFEKKDIAIIDKLFGSSFPQIDGIASIKEDIAYFLNDNNSCLQQLILTCEDLNLNKCIIQ